MALPMSLNEMPTVKSPKKFNSQIGLPLSLLQISEKHQLGIFEVGISKPSEMQVLEDIFSPKIGVLLILELRILQILKMMKND